ncbi:MAG: hypothetical protein KA502_01060 [Candidatus Methanomethylophilaceae archaeon]|nr:hypothetical protein [Candidatus Methanomethylophilaceae archaeon]
MYNPTSSSFIDPLFDANRCGSLPFDARLNHLAEFLARDDRIACVSILDGDALDDLKAEEECVQATGGMEYENRALRDCFGKDAVICLFCDGFLEEPHEITIAMEDSSGNRIGHDVPKCMMAEYETRKDAVWIASNFLVYPNIRQMSEAKVVILPQSLRLLDGIAGVSDVVSFYTCTSADIMLKRRYMERYEPSMCTLIAGFDFENGKH